MKLHKRQSPKWSDMMRHWLYGDGLFVTYCGLNDKDLKTTDKIRTVQCKTCKRARLTEC